MTLDSLFVNTNQTKNKQCHAARDEWLKTESESLKDFLPVGAAGAGSVAEDYRFVMASTRQQRLFARAMELRLGEYLETYDDERASAVDEAYRNGDIDQVCACVCVVCGLGDPCRIAIVASCHRLSAVVVCFLCV